jgi:hypothetical protein
MLNSRNEETSAALFDKIKELEGRVKELEAGLLYIKKMNMRTDMSRASRRAKTTEAIDILLERDSGLQKERHNPTLE